MTTSAAAVLTNVTELTTNATTAPPYERPFSDEEILVAAVLLVFLAVAGIFGNVVTIMVILTTKNLRSIFELFILSMCVSDLYSAIISPLLLYRRTWGFDRWLLPNFFCKFYWASDLWTSYATAQHILSFALLRYIAIKWPHKISEIKKKHATIWLVAIWAATFLSGFIPFAIFMESGIRDRSSAHVTAKWPACTCAVKWVNQCRWYTSIGHPVFFYLPTIIILILSIIIALTLWKRTFPGPLGRVKRKNSENRRNVKERQAILQLFLIVTSFFCGYIPFTAYAFYTQSRQNTGNQGLREDWLFGISYYICMRISECLNPLFYNVGSTKMRSATREFFLRCRSCNRNSPPEERSSGSNSKLSVLGATTKKSSEREIPAISGSFDEPVIQDERPL